MDFVTNQIMSVIFICAVLSFFAGIAFERFQARLIRRAWKARKAGGWADHGRIVPFGREQAPLVDAADQLRVVMRAAFAKQRILSKTEARVFFAVEQALEQAGVGWRLMAQVNLGEILSSEDAQAYAAINSKRVDMLVIATSGLPIAAIEYQGSGHHQGTSAARDAVKKEALRKAGVSYFEVTPDDGPDDVRRMIARMTQLE